MAGETPTPIPTPNQSAAPDIYAPSAEYDGMPAGAIWEIEERNSSGSGLNSLHPSEFPEGYIPTYDLMYWPEDKIVELNQTAEDREAFAADFVQQVVNTRPQYAVSAFYLMSGAESKRDWTRRDEELMAATYDKILPHNEDIGLDGARIAFLSRDQRVREQATRTLLGSGLSPELQALVINEVASSGASWRSESMRYRGRADKL